jgi:hypothetical protein
MLMIDLVDEKKSLGFSSVTQVTEAWLTRYLPYTRSGRNARSGALRSGSLPRLGQIGRHVTYTKKMCRTA